MTSRRSHAAADRPTLFVYIHDEAGGGARPLGGAAKWRLAKSLASLESELSARGARLDIIEGDAEPRSSRSLPQRTPIACSGPAVTKAAQKRWTRASKQRSKSTASKR